MNRKLASHLFIALFCLQRFSHAKNSDPPSTPYQKYIIKIQKKLKKRPRSPKLHTILGRLYQRSGKLTAAKKQYKLALRLRPRYSHALVGLAHIALRNHKLTRAQQLLAQVLRQNPKHPPALVERSELYRLQAQRSKHPKIRKKRLQQAILSLRQAIASAPKPPYLYRLGLLYLATGQFAEARLRFLTAVAKRSFQPCYRMGLYLSEALLTQKHKLQVHKKLQQEYALCPQPLLRTMARRTLLALSIGLARRLAARGKNAQAIALLKRERKRNPQAVQSHLFLVLLLYENGQCKEAKRALQRMLRTHPRHPLAKKLLRDPKLMQCQTPTPKRRKFMPHTKTKLQILQVRPALPTPKAPKRRP